MKKIMTIILAAILLGISATGMTGCAYDIEKYFISDGDFVYFYMENMPEYSNREYNRKCYAIVGTNPQGLKTEIYVPAYYKGKEVCYTWFVDTSLAQNEYGVDVTGAEKVYFPYTHKIFVGDYSYVIALDSTKPMSSFYVNCSPDYVEKLLRKSNVTQGVYVNPIAYHLKYEEYSEFSGFEEVNGYLMIFQDGSYFQTANTSYMFNYEGEPNEGYFFINEFERGGLIEDTPYEPQRAGYKFAGWYKEAACINAWDFERDRLPQAEYDADGNLKFIETKLYAKWVKN